MTAVEPRPSRSLLAGILLLAFLLRLGAALWLAGPAITVSESGQTAANLAAGRGYTFDFYGYRSTAPLRSFMPPLYTLVVAACIELASNPLLALRLVQAALSTLLTLTVYLLARDLFGGWVGMVAGILSALYPVYILMVAQPTSVIVHALLSLVLVLALLGLARRSTARQALLAGGCLALNVLAHPAISGFALVIPLWLWFMRARLAGSWLVLTGWVWLGAAVLVAPWLARNIAVQGTWAGVSTNGGFTFWNGNNPFTAGTGFDVDLDRLDAYQGRASGASGGRVQVYEPYPLPRELAPQVQALSEVDLDRALYSAGFTFIRQDPRRWMELVGARLLAFWWFRPNIGTYRDFYPASWILPYEILYTVILALFGAGVWAARRAWRTLSLPLWLLVYTSGVDSFFQVNTRYRWELEAALFPFVSLTLALLGRHLVGRLGWRRHVRRAHG